MTEDCPLMTPPHGDGLGMGVPIGPCDRDQLGVGLTATQVLTSGVGADFGRVTRGPDRVDFPEGPEWLWAR